MFEFLEEFGVGRGIIRTIVTFLVLFVLVMIVIGMCSKYIHPWETGIKQVSWGNTGFYDGYPGGKRYVYVPFRDTLHIISLRLQTIDILCEYVGGENALSEVGQRKKIQIVAGTGVEIQTTDGSKVTSDISIIYHIFSKASAQGDEIVHGGPLDLIKKYGTSPIVWKTMLQQKAEGACKKALGSLQTNDYYNAPLREEKARLAEKMLNKGFTDEKGVFQEGWNKYGIEIVAVLIRAYYYTDVINDAIFKKNIQIQEEKLKVAQETAATYAADVSKVTAEGDAIIQSKKIEGESNAKVILAEAGLYERTKNSEGDLKVKTAEAEVKKMETDALDEGGSLYVAQQMSEKVVSRLKGGVISDLQEVFDFDKWVQLLGGKSYKKEGIK